MRSKCSKIFVVEKIFDEYADGPVCSCLPACFTANFLHLRLPHGGFIDVRHNRSSVLFPILGILQEGILQQEDREGLQEAVGTQQQRCQLKTGLNFFQSLPQK